MKVDHVTITSDRTAIELGSTIELRAELHNSGSATRYRWSARDPFGSFERESEAAATFTCNHAGPTAVAVVVGTGDGSACETTAELAVECQIPMPSGETATTAPEESKCPDLAGLPPRSDVRLACNILGVAQRGYLPKTFNFAQAATLVGAFNRAAALFRRHASGELSEAQVAPLAAPIDAECAAISGIASCEELFHDY